MNSSVSYSLSVTWNVSRAVCCRPGQQEELRGFNVSQRIALLVWTAVHVFGRGVAPRVRTRFVSAILRSLYDQAAILPW